MTVKGYERHRPCQFSNLLHEPKKKHLNHRLQKNTDYQGLAEFKALTLWVNYDKKKFDT